MIIVLNGTSSAGKSSIAKALQSLAKRPLLHVQMDSFLEMMPARYANHPDAFLFETTTVDGSPEVSIETGPYGEALMMGMRRAFASLADAGLDLIIDDVLITGDADAYRDALTGHDVKWVGVQSTLDVAETRERDRGDRMIGLARWQHPRVHVGIHYDLILDTTDTSADACAAQIRDAFDL